MANYAVFFDGKAYVEAESPEDAIAAFYEDDAVYSEVEATKVSEVSEFVIRVPAGYADG